METGKTLDTKILEILFEYYKRNKGEPDMPLTDLYANLSYEDQNKIHTDILKLQDDGWVGCQFLGDGMSGLVWIEPRGIKIMSARTPSPQKPVKQEESEPSPEKSAALIPGYQHDIFVSCCGDDDPEWVKKTITTLKELMAVVCKGEFDHTPQWVLHQEWTPEARKDAENSATFLVMFSQQYRTSSWGASEDKGFLDMLEQRTKQNARVFLLTLDQAEYPRVLCRATIRSLICETPEQDNSHQNMSELLDLSKDILEDLRRLMRQAEARQQLGSKGVVIDNDPVDQQLAEKLTQKLQKFGVKNILPIPTKGKSPSDLRKASEDLIKGTDGLLLVYGEVPESWLFREVNRMRRIFANPPQSSQPSAYAIYNGPPPEETLSGAFAFPGLILDCRTCQKLDQDCEECPGKHTFSQFVERLKEERPHG